MPPRMRSSPLNQAVSYAPVAPYLSYPRNNQKGIKLVKTDRDETLLAPRRQRTSKRPEICTQEQRAALIQWAEYHDGYPSSLEIFEMACRINK